MNTEYVCTVVLNYQTWQLTQDCVQSLLACQHPNHSIVVVDNASPNESIPALKAYFNTLDNQPKPILTDSYAAAVYIVGQHTITFIESTVNGGYSAGNNIGLRYGLAQGADYFWILNNDTVVHSEALSALIRYAGQPAKEYCGPIGSVLLNDDAAHTIQAIGGRYVSYLGVSFPVGAGLTPGQLRDILSQPNYVIGAACFVSRLFVERVGLMREDYFLYYEDTEWTFRGRQQGFEPGFCLDSFVTHYDGGSTRPANAGRVSPLVEYYFARNKIRFAKQYCPYWLPFILLSVLGAMLIRLLKGNTKAAGLIGNVTAQELISHASAYQSS